MENYPPKHERRSSWHPLPSPSTSAVQDSSFHHRRCHPPQRISISSLTVQLQRLQNRGRGPKTKTFSHIFQECSVGKSLRPGKQAHARMIVSGFVTTVFVTNCLIEMYKKCSRLDCARKVFDIMPERDTVTWNAIISGYASSGNMELAVSLFDSIPDKNVISWNSLMSGYEQNGDYCKSIDVFTKMRKMGLELDHSTFSILPRVCSVLENLHMGVQVHGLAIRTGFHNNVVAATALLDMYAKCEELDSSFRLFLEIPEANLVSWSALIAGCVQNDRLMKGIEVFVEMQRSGVGVSQSTYASVFRSCAGLAALTLGTQLHGHSLKNGFKSDATVMTASLDMYAKCGRLREGRKLFDLMPKHNLESYNAIIVGCVQNDEGSEALHLFRFLQRSVLGFNEISLSGALSGCRIIKGLPEGRQLHGLAVKSNVISNICVNAVLDMYGKCGVLGEACCVFDEMERRDAVSWNAIITAHEQNEDEERTIKLFSAMIGSGLEPDEFTYGSVLKACASNKYLGSGTQFHTRTIKSGMCTNSFVGIALIDMYSKCGNINEAETINSGLDERSIVSWNAIISGFALHEQSEEAQRHFSRMLDTGLGPDTFTYATVLDTCANLATESFGKQLHAQILKQRLQSDVYICSTLVDMYSKCGNLKDSTLMFEKAMNRDFVTWNAMICGYSQHGLGDEALRIFERMQIHNLKPNPSTFISVLRACAHIGNYRKGMEYFEMMQKKYGLCPQVEHYFCMVDILGRSGRVEDALELITEMPIEADSVIWRNLLNTCSIHGNIEVAEKAAAVILEMEPGDSSTYVLLSNIYANAEMWGEVSRLRKAMRSNGLRKEPGYSWIEVADQVHMFLVGDVAHPRCGEIYAVLDLLINEMKESPNTYGSEFPHCDWTEEDESSRGRCGRKLQLGLDGGESLVCNGYTTCHL